MYKINICEETGMARSTVGRYLQEMYEKSMLKGPMLSVKPAQNFHEYVYLLSTNDYNLVYKGLGKFPHVTSVTLSSGFWNLLLTTDRQVWYASSRTGVLKNYDRSKEYFSIVCIIP